MDKVFINAELKHDEANWDQLFNQDGSLNDLGKKVNAEILAQVRTDVAGVLAKNGILTKSKNEFTLTDNDSLTVKPVPPPPPPPET